MKEEGFTLLEMLLVLGVISILSVVTYFNLYPLYEKKKAEQFVEQFSQDVLLMQQFAISHRNYYTLRWFPHQSMYSISATGGSKPVFQRYYDEAIEVDLYTFPNPMTYSSTGNINRGGTIIITYKSLTYRIVFQLGRGRFTYYEM